MIENMEVIEYGPQEDGPTQLYLKDKKHPPKEMCGEVYYFYEIVEYNPTTKTLSYSRRGDWWEDEFFKYLDKHILQVEIHYYK